jgi:hypothetical protein
MGRVSWAVALLCGCGSRTALDVPEVRDAAVGGDATPPSDVPCAARDYDVQGYVAHTGFAVTGGYIYVVSTATYDVVRFGTEGTAAETVTSSDNGNAWFFFVDDTYVWWTSTASGQIWRAPNGGGPKEAVACAACPSKAGIVGLTSSVLVLSDQSNALYALSKADGSVTSFFQQKKPTAPPITLVGDDAHVFWTTDEYVFEATAGALEPTIDDGWPTGLALHGDDVYWTATDNGTNELVHRAVSGGPTNVIYTGALKGPLGANASYVYGQTASGIERVSIVTGESTLIAPYVYPWRMIIDGSCIYSLDKGGHVFHVPG